MALSPVNEQNRSPDQSKSGHAVNIRFSMPFFGRRYFLAILGGSEKRSPERRTTDRGSHPIKTTSNILFVAGFAVIFYIIAFIAIAIQSSIVEF